jgi:hypothetical protein
MKDSRMFIMRLSELEMMINLQFVKQLDCIDKKTQKSIEDTLAKIGGKKLEDDDLKKYNEILKIPAVQEAIAKEKAKKKKGGRKNKD